MGIRKTHTNGKNKEKKKPQPFEKAATGECARKAEIKSPLAVEVVEVGQIWKRIKGKSRNGVRRNKQGQKQGNKIDCGSNILTLV